MDTWGQFVRTGALGLITTLGASGTPALFGVEGLLPISAVKERLLFIAGCVWPAEAPPPPPPRVPEEWELLLPSKP